MSSEKLKWLGSSDQSVEDFFSKTNLFFDPKIPNYKKQNNEFESRKNIIQRVSHKNSLKSVFFLWKKKSQSKVIKKKLILIFKFF